MSATASCWLVASYFTVPETSRIHQKSNASFIHTVLVRIRQEEHCTRVHTLSIITEHEVIVFAVYKLYIERAPMIDDCLDITACDESRTRRTVRTAV